MAFTRLAAFQTPSGLDAPSVRPSVQARIKPRKACAGRGGQMSRRRRAVAPGKKFARARKLPPPAKDRIRCQSPADFRIGAGSAQAFKKIFEKQGSFARRETARYPDRSTSRSGSISASQPDPRTVPIDGSAQYDGDIAKLHSTLFDQFLPQIIRDSHHAVRDDDAFGELAPRARKAVRQNAKDQRERRDRAAWTDFEGGERPLDRDGGEDARRAELEKTRKAQPLARRHDRVEGRDLIACVWFARRRRDSDTPRQVSAPQGLRRQPRRRARPASNDRICFSIATITLPIFI